MTHEELRAKVLERGNLPRHIAIIMDGNGRWAQERSLPRLAGHREGINSVREITRICGEIGLGHLTLYTFSQENWDRPRLEVTALMRLLLSTIRKEVENLNANNVRLSTIGALEELPAEARQGIEEGIELTRHNTGLNLNLALSYGSRQEILQAARLIAERIRRGDLEPGQVDEDLFSRYLDTTGVPDPELLIRTGGELRLSNFLLWQLAYTEIYVTATFWPAFREAELMAAISDYQRRERRFGKVSSQLTP